MTTKIRSRKKHLSSSDEKEFEYETDNPFNERPDDILVTTDRNGNPVLEQKSREENKQCCCKCVKQKDKAACTSLGPVYAAVSLDILGMVVAIPVIPYLVKNIAPSTEVFPQLENFFVGIPFAIYYIAHGVGSAAVGRISDIIGRRPSVRCLQ